MNAEKIFVEVDEEIIFIAEKVREASADRILLVLPKQALLLGSVISLKLLAREISRINRVVILVSEDLVGKGLAKKTDFVIVSKVSDITKDSWIRAEAYKNKLLQSLDVKKEELIGERHENVESEDEPVKETLLVEEDSDVIEKEAKVKPEEEDKPHIEKEDKKEISHTRKKAQEDEGVLVTPTVVEVDGYKMISGGDIYDYPELMPNYVSRQSTEVHTETEYEKKNVEKKNRVDKKKRKKSSLLTAHNLEKKVVKGKSSAEALQTFSHNAQNFLKGLVSKIIKGGIVTKVVLAVVLFYIFSYFFLATGEMTVFVKKSTITAEREVIANTAVSELNLDTLTIPAKFAIGTYDKSANGPTSGKVDNGEAATGEILVLNKTTKDITLSAGTVFTETVKGLKYISNFDVVVPAGEEGATSFEYGSATVGVTAESFGEKYNTNGDKLDYTVSGYSEAELASGNLKDLKGGTEVQVSVVDQSDIDKLKAGLIEQLKQEALKDIKAKQGDSVEVLDDSFTYDIITETPTPALGGEGSSLDLTLEIEAKVLTFSKDDLVPLSEYIVQKEAGENLNIEKYDYETKDIELVGDVIKLKLNITATVTQSLDTSTIASDLAGKKSSDVEAYMKDKGDIDRYILKTGPFWMPNFLKHLPSNSDKIKVNITKLD